MGFQSTDEYLVKWDAVERELVILSQSHIRIANAYRALSNELHRERESGTTGLYEGSVSADAPKNKEGPEGLTELQRALF